MQELNAYEMRTFDSQVVCYAVFKYNSFVLLYSLLSI